MGHGAAQIGLSSALKNIDKKFVFLYIRLLGYPFTHQSRILARMSRIVLDKGNKRLLDVGCSHGAFDF